MSAWEVAKKIEKRQLVLDRPLDHGTEINLHVPALIPADYLPDVHLRLVLYKRIAGADTVEGVQRLQEEVVDRFGRLPEAARLLFKAAELKVKVQRLGVRKIDAGAKGIRVEFIEQPPIDPGAVLKLLQTAPKRYRLDGPNRLRVLGEFPDGEARLQAAGELIAALGAPVVAPPVRATQASR